MDDTDSAIRHVVGVMTGTSLDGMDAALVRIEGRGLAIRAALVRQISRPLGDLSGSLRAAAEQKPATAGAFATMAWEFGELHARTVQELLNPAHFKTSVLPDLICVHGQTVFHQPPHSWQLVNTAPIAERFGCPVVSDLRQADLAAGGQGAPITPIADWILFHDPKKTRAIINLGGFCNVTILGGDALEAIRGFDVCACNHVLDTIARETLGVPYDQDGRIAATASPNSKVVEHLTARLTGQRASRRSLGTGDELTDWIIAKRDLIPPAEFMASAVQAVSLCIAEVLAPIDPDEVIVAGGGAKNPTLLDSLYQSIGERPMPGDDFGVPIDAREAMCFAVLGALCADGVPITLRLVTGCRTPVPISGTWCGINPRNPFVRA